MLFKVIFTGVRFIISGDKVEERLDDKLFNKLVLLTSRLGYRRVLDISDVSIFKFSVEELVIVDMKASNKFAVRSMVIDDD